MIERPEHEKRVNAVVGMVELAGVADGRTHQRAARILRRRVRLLHVQRDGVAQVYLVAPLGQPQCVAARAAAHVEDGGRHGREEALDQLTRARGLEAEVGLQALRLRVALVKDADFLIERGHGRQLCRTIE